MLMFVLLLILLLVFSIRRGYECFSNSKIAEIDCGDYKDNAWDQNGAGTCEKCCSDFAEKNYVKTSLRDKWKPFSFWTNRWYQTRFDVNGKKRYRLTCKCNVTS